MSLVISIRQPWAHLIVHGPKRIENRTWRTKIRGPVLIHAAKGMTQEEYLEACDFIASRKIEVEIPHPSEMRRGGIIGRANLVDCIQESADPWFCGPWGHVLADPEPLPFQPLKGALGYFHVEPGAFLTAPPTHEQRELFGA